MPRGPLAELLCHERLVAADSAAVNAFNRRAKEQHRLHPELGPNAFEGDIDTAAIVLLLANPGYDATSTTEDHTFVREGWPLSCLHPEAPVGLRKWWQDRLRPLVSQIGEERVSKTVACLQITPWASSKFNDSLRLPSRVSILHAASQCAGRGAVMLVMRAEKLWLEADVLRTTNRRFRVNSWRSSFVSPGNLPEEGWAAVIGALRAA